MGPMTANIAHVHAEGVQDAEQDIDEREDSQRTRVLPRDEHLHRSAVLVDRDAPTVRHHHHVAAASAIRLPVVPVLLTVVIRRAPAVGHGGVEHVLLRMWLRRKLRVRHLILHRSRCYPRTTTFLPANHRSLLSGLGNEDGPAVGGSRGSLLLRRRGLLRWHALQKGGLCRERVRPRRRTRRARTRRLTHTAFSSDRLGKRNVRALVSNLPPSD
jgi:hypothetical protein